MTNAKDTIRIQVSAPLLRPSGASGSVTHAVTIQMAPDWLWSGQVILAPDAPGEMSPVGDSLDSWISQGILAAIPHLKEAGLSERQVVDALGSGEGETTFAVPSKTSRELAAALAADADVWRAIEDAHRSSMPSAEHALACLVQLVRDAQVSLVAGRVAESATAIDGHPDFSIVEVRRVSGGSCARHGQHFEVTARLWGPIAGPDPHLWGGRLTTWRGFQLGDHLTCTGWDSADQWIDGTVERLIGTAAAVELGERILASAEARS